MLFRDWNDAVSLFVDKGMKDAKAGRACWYGINMSGEETVCMTIDHVAIYVRDLKKPEIFLSNILTGKWTTGDGYYESCIVGIEGNLIEITI